MCNDPRLALPPYKPNNQQDYTRNLTKGDLCTNSADYLALQEYVLELRKKIAKLEVNRGRK